jgi:hypothetical protein
MREERESDSEPTRSPDNVRNIVKNLEAKIVELALPLKLVDALNKHEIDWESALNLGYYRSSVKCLCGAGWWYGIHEGDPSAEDMWSIHQAEVLAPVLQATNSKTVPRENSE